MTNPDDWWRHQTSARPHDMPHDLPHPGMPLTDPPLGWGGGAPDPSTIYTGPVNPVAQSIGLKMAGAFLVFIFSAPIFGTLYPLAALSAYLAGRATDRFLTGSFPIADDRLPFALLAGAVVFWTVCRLDHRLAARLAPYRWARHVTRVLLIGSCFALDNMEGRLIPRSPTDLLLLYGLPINLAFVIVGALIAHFILTRKGLRASWDGALEFVRLRPKGL